MAKVVNRNKGVFLTKNNNLIPFVNGFIYIFAIPIFFFFLLQLSHTHSIVPSGNESDRHFLGLFTLGIRNSGVAATCETSSSNASSSSSP